MKNQSILIPILLALCTSCDVKRESAFFTATNAIDIERTEVIVLTKSQITEKLPTLEADEIPVIKDQDGNLIPYQLDDIDSDDTWDELSIAVPFAANEIKKLVLEKVSNSDAPKFEKMTDVHMGIGKAKPIASEVQKYVRTVDPRNIDSLFIQMEGPAWENDKVGFRMYFDPRNGIDIFGKTTTQPTLHKQGLSTNYHDQANWGMDILKVGTSLGAGSVALKYKDSLYRLQGVYGATFKTITEGPARAIFEMVYLDEPVGDKRINVTHRISIEKGDWFYKSEIMLYGQTAGMELVTGIVNLKPNVLSSDKSINNMFIMRSYGLQSENKDNLGMALIVPNSDVTLSAAPETGDGITQTHLINLKTGDKHNYYFMSGWEPSDMQFKTSEGFKQATLNAASMIANPIKIQ